MVCRRKEITNGNLKEENSHHEPSLGQIVVFSGMQRKRLYIYISLSLSLSLHRHPRGSARLRKKTVWSVWFICSIYISHLLTCIILSHCACLWFTMVCRSMPQLCIFKQPLQADSIPPHPPWATWRFFRRRKWSPWGHSSTVGLHRKVLHKITTQWSHDIPCPLKFASSACNSVVHCRLVKEATWRTLKNQLLPKKLCLRHWHRLQGCAASDALIFSWCRDMSWSGDPTCFGGQWIICKWTCTSNWRLGLKIQHQATWKPCCRVTCLASFLWVSACTQALHAHLWWKLGAPVFAWHTLVFNIHVV